MQSVTIVPSPRSTAACGLARCAGEIGSSNDTVFSAEYPAIYWLEENGYNVSYISGEQLATASNDSLLLNHQVYMDVGHDEYWTDQQYLNVLAAGQAGVNLMFLSGNEVFWQTQFAPSIDATADPNRTLVDLQGHPRQRLDRPHRDRDQHIHGCAVRPVNGFSSGGWRARGTNQLTGQFFPVDSYQIGTITIPYDQTQLRFWANTPIAEQTQPGQTASLVNGLLGYEWDSSPNNAFTPAGLVDLSSTTLQVTTKLLDYGNTTGNGTATHNLVEFRDPVSGALVFGAGTVFWSWGLADVETVYEGSAALSIPMSSRRWSIRWPTWACSRRRWRRAW